MEPLRARKREIDKARQQLIREYVEVDEEIKRRGDGGHARAVARDINQRIIADGETLPHFIWASQNIAATVALLQRLPEPTTPKDHRAHHEIHTLLERAAVQQAESSLSWRREPNAYQRTPSVQPARDALVHQVPQGSG